jgi:DNA recombination protein RmuC
VEATLKRYEEGLQRVEKERVEHYAGLREAVELVRAGQGQVRDETRKLVGALTASSKVRGNWGEQSLKNVLELAGLSPYADYQSEVSVNTEDGRLRPDVVVRLPGGGQMIIDSKISFNAYMEAHHEADEIKKAGHLQAHLTSIKNHVTKLSSKNYWDQFEGSAEFVVMYVAGEHFLHAAVDLEPGLWQWAIGKKVLLATPTNLLALAQTAAMYWKHDIINREARDIADLGKELHLRLCTMAEHMERVGKNLATANSAYNQMIGSFNDKLVPQARRFEQLGSGSAKDIPNPPIVETTPKSPTKLSAPKPSANEDDAAA